MINWIDKTIILQDKTYPIRRFEVWFATPWGLIHDFETAATEIVKRDADPDATLVPVPVAVSDGGIYEVCVRV